MSGRVLVTGATGYAGGHLARFLAARGQRVRALVRDRARAEALVHPAIELQTGDLRDDASLARAVCGIEVVHHLAGVFRPANVSREEFFAINADGAARLVEHAARAGVRRVVHCSSVGVYGDPIELPASEATAPAPAYAYQESKLEGERRALEIAARSGLALSVLRPAAIYGPRERRFLPLVRLIERQRFVMFGSGEIFYHFIHVDDLCQAFALTASHPAAPGRIYNVADAQPVTLNELVALLVGVLGVEPPRLRLPRFVLDAATRLCEAACRPLGIAPPLHGRRAAWFHHSRAYDARRISSELGFVPKWRLEEGLAAMLQSYREAGWL